MSKKSKVLSFSGVDGCGKTTIIENLMKRLSGQGIKNKYIWLRYNHYLTKSLLLLCRVIGLTKYEYIEGMRIGYHEFYKSKLISILFILLTYIDTLLVSIVKVYIPSILYEEIIICDRWILDIIVDLEVDTNINFKKHPILKRLFLSLLPDNCICFYINRDSRYILEKRRENIYDKNYPKRLELYEIHSNSDWLTVIDNNKPIELSVSSIYNKIINDE